MTITLSACLAACSGPATGDRASGSSAGSTAGGSNRFPLTSRPGLSYGPDWSPDGAWLIYTAGSAGDDDFDIRAVHIEDCGDIAIVATPGDEREASWGPGRERGATR